jgi:hypothetical protein
MFQCSMQYPRSSQTDGRYQQPQWLITTMLSHVPRETLRKGRATYCEPLPNGKHSASIHKDTGQFERVVSPGSAFQNDMN